MKKALAIFTAYYRRLEGAVGKFVAAVKGEHRTSNTQHSTSNEDGAASVPPDVTQATIRDNTLLAPRLSGERNEVRGFSSGETTSTEIADAFQSTSSPLPSPPLHGGEGDGLAGSAKFPPTSITTTSRNASTREHTLPAPPLSGERNEVRGSDGAQSNPTPRTPNPAPDKNFITRQDLKRELDSLRRLIESRK